MKLGFILTAYDRIDDLLAHLDILKFYGQPYEVIPIWMRQDVPDYFLKEMEKYKHAHYCDGVRFTIGPLLGLCSGLRKAAEAGIEYVVYRNGDDWLFNHDFVSQNLKIMDEGKDVAAYNWLSFNTMAEFALNEMYVRVDKFIKTVDDAERYFRGSGDKFLCELKMSRWIRRTLGRNLDNGFYRLPDREIDPGIGYERETLAQTFEFMGKPMPPGLLESLEDNHRFFNRKWQLIGSHNNLQRFSFYNNLRGEIPYHIELERQEHFKRWIDNVMTGGKWNMEMDKSKRQVPIDTTTYPKHKVFFRFQKLPAVRVPKMLPRRRATAAVKTTHHNAGEASQQ